MSRQARAVVPRWRKPAPVPQIMLGRKQEKALVRRLSAPAVPAVPAFRYRYQLIPLAWGLALTLTGLGFWLTHRRAALDVATGAIAAVLIVAGSRHLSAYARRAAAVTGCLTALWLPLIAALGPKPSLPLFAICWAILTLSWVRHYRVRPQAEPEDPAGDEVTWARLAAKMRWHGTLGAVEKIPAGKRYPILLDGAETHIGEVIAQPRRIAAAWSKPVTEAYVEPAPDGIESRGLLTILSRGTLSDVREWDGSGVTPDGFAVIGRYADGAPARTRLFAPMDGTRHGILAGTTGAGKSSTLDLLIQVMLASGFILPVILDPQEGQSLPQWRDRLPYAAGPSECMEMLDLVHAGMLGRSRQLSRMTWDDEGHPVRGMPFFDHVLTGWPVVAVIADEHPLLLTDRQCGADAIRRTADIGKLGRKTGVALWPAAQVPSLSELGDQVVRAMLVGGNVVCLRTGERVSQGMLGLPSDPSELPRYFGSGEPTYGLGYILGPDNRQAIARVDMPSKAARRLPVGIPDLEPAFAEKLARFGSALPLAASSPAPSLAVVDDSPAPGGQTAADAVLAVLDRPMERGPIIRLAQDKSREWGRDRPFSLKAISGALRKLTEEGRVSHPAERGPYSPVRPSLSLIGGIPSQAEASAGNTAAGGTA